MPLSFIQTPLKKCKSIIFSKEHFYNTKHLKFNPFACLLRCLSNLSATASRGVHKYSSLCVFVLEVVLTKQKHSGFKHFYTHPEVIEQRSGSTNVLLSNIQNHLVITVELHQFSMFHGKIIEAEASVERSSVKELA